MATLNITLRVEELRDRSALPEQELMAIIEHGIIEPRDAQANVWEFEPQMAEVAARAARLHRDLDIDWQGVALALDLLQEIEELKRENHRLKVRLSRLES
ncbi:MAG: chaperone modulator CbpM [Pseudomonadota bacterium]